MTIAARIEQYLEEQGVEYEIIDHPIAFTAQEEAAASHVPGRQWAKTVEVLLDGRPAICHAPIGSRQASGDDRGGDGQAGDGGRAGQAVSGL